MTIALHLMAPGDAPLLDRVADDVFDEPIDPARLRAYLGEPGHLLILALDGGPGAPLVVGQCAAVLHRHPDKPPELYVDEVGVAPSHRRRGLGRALMERMLLEGRARGCDEAWLGTESDNAEANALYRRLGGEGPDPFVLYAFDLGAPGRAA